MSGVTVTTQDRIATVVIDRPPVNALSRDTYREIRQVFDSFRDRDDISVAVLTGAGDRVFCGGRDIHDLRVERSEPKPVNVADPMHLTREAFFAVRHCAVPVICAVNGAAVGAGVALAAVSDIVLAVQSATFALTEIDVGVLGAASFAQWMVGPAKARWMFYTGQRVPAEEMYRLGAIEAVVEPAELLPRAHALATVIAGKDPVAIRMAKASVVRTDTLPLETAYRTEQDYTRHLSAYPNSAEAISRFVDKR
ncbi:enoyl-CoA hydratase-related protein [Nocardia jiangxiensis]|uniref:Enoyl-CoA hydratase-related protein n=1 Tax=Nocardia jiangxiensis TaxID=282685 RepID=A0ABW6RUC1_9NOCA|nr:enoyl-CoA hydratase-related protein [Nocardia jiangxiensis]